VQRLEVALQELEPHWHQTVGQRGVILHDRGPHPVVEAHHHLVR
jgi:hypothetical protein